MAPDCKFLSLLTLFCFNFFERVCFSMARSSIDLLMVVEFSSDFMFSSVFSIVVLCELRSFWTDS